MDRNLKLHWQIIFNPHAGCGKGRRDKALIESALQDSGLSYQLSISDFPGHAKQLAFELRNKGFTNFIIAGGDGTLHEVVNGVFSAGDIENITIGVIPVGTGNDWIRTFGIPDNYKRAIDLIIDGKTVIQDVGEITNNKSKLEKRYFVNIAGFGFDALVAGNANLLKNKGVSGLRVYIQSFLWSYMNFRAGQVVIQIDKENVRANLFSTSVGIGKFNGGGMMQVPDANPVKGIFHITIIRKMNIWGIYRNFKKLYDGTFVSDSRVSTHAGKEIRIKAFFPLFGEADGESLGDGSFTLRIIPHKLRVIYGNTNFD